MLEIVVKLQLLGDILTCRPWNIESFLDTHFLRNCANRADFPGAQESARLGSLPKPC